MDSRRAFAKEVAATVAKMHGAKQDESYVIGISGKWGEGKTRFLALLETELRCLDGDRHFLIVELNPWKFAADGNSFMRNLLKKLQRSQCLLQKAQDACLWMWTGKRPLEELSSDVTSTGIRSWVLIAASTAGALAYALYRGPLNDALSPFAPFLTVAAVPLAIGALASSLSIRKGSKQVQTPDQFDSMLDVLLKRMADRRIVVFVDDLDRVSSTNARTVLDSLRTFFDKPQLTFVVTGDHSVLERSLGTELLGAEALPAERLDEGRRFLKKIFDLYWRLPQLVDSEFGEFLEQELSSRQAELADFFSESELGVLRNHLTKYFDRNPRHVIRFLDMSLLTLRMVRMQLDLTSDDTQDYLKDLLSNPLHVARVLMIQDLCTPLFEHMLRNPGVLVDLEYEVDRRSASIEERLATLSSEIEVTPAQWLFFRNFLFDLPRFVADTRLCVRDFRPFLYLAGDAGFEDARGPKPADFLEAIVGGNGEQVGANLKLAGGPMLQKGHEVFLGHAQLVSGDPALLDHMVSILRALKDLPAEHQAQRAVVDGAVLNVLGPSLDAATPQSRIELLKMIWEWVDRVDVDGTLQASSEYGSLMRFRNPGDLNAIGVIGPSAAALRIVSAWLCERYASDPAGVVSLSEALLADESVHDAGNCLQPIGSRLADDLVTDQDSTRRTARLKLLQRNVEDGDSLASETVAAACTALRWDLVDWAISLVGTGPWSREQLDGWATDGIAAIDDLQSFSNQLVSARGRLSPGVDQLWLRLIGERWSMLLPFLRQQRNSGLQDLAPGKVVCDSLFDALRRDVGAESSTGAKLDILDLMRRPYWMWAQYPASSHPVLTRVAGMKNNRDTSIADAVKAVLESWKS